MLFQWRQRFKKNSNNESNNEILVSPTKKRADRLPAGFFVCKTYQTAPFLKL